MTDFTDSLCPACLFLFPAQLSALNKNSMTHCIMAPYETTLFNPLVLMIATWAISVFAPKVNIQIIFRRHILQYITGSHLGTILLLSNLIIQQNRI